jgi:hypothetical protein
VHPLQYRTHRTHLEPIEMWKREKEKEEEKENIGEGEIRFLFEKCL